MTCDEESEIVQGVYWAGFALGLANALRHRVSGYRTPRPRGTEPRRYNEKVVRRWIDRGGIDFRGRHILELGPGPDLGTRDIALRLGAASYLAVDVFPLAEPQDGYLMTSYPDMPNVEGPFDLIVSNAALEHFDDVRGTFRRLSELAAPSCVMCHHVDAKTHMRFVKERDPLNILRYSERAYRVMSFPGAPNRLRASHYVEYLEEVGFSVRVAPGRCAPSEYVDSLELPRAYARNDLVLLSFTVVGERRACVS